MIQKGANRTGLEYVVEAIEQRFRVDSDGRLVMTHLGANVPRFVLGRAAEGCIWRFAADLPESQIRAIAKLAGREKGCAFGGEGPAPPERLVMIARLLGPIASSGPNDTRGQDHVVPTPHRETMTNSGKIVGELWSID